MTSCACSANRTFRRPIEVSKQATILHFSPYNHEPTLNVGPTVFQSSPALSSGRYARNRPIADQPSGFNPRPPFRAGATDAGACPRLAAHSFNPRPPFRAGATADGCPPCPTHDCFNPRPPFRAGATRTTHAGLSVHAGFNPRPPFRAGATPWRYPSPP